MIFFLAAAFGVLASLAAHDIAAQSLHEQPFRVLSGTCPRCGARRGWASPACPECGRPPRREFGFAVISALGAIAFVNTVGLSWVLPAYAGFLLLSMALATTDLDTMRIVDRLNLRGTLVLIALLGVGAIVESQLDDFWRGLLGSLAYFVGTNLMFFLVKGRGFGYGDVKLSVQLGLFTAFISWGTLGWSVLITAFVGGLLSIGVITVGAMRRVMAKRRGAETPSMRDILRTEVPYGPSMIIGAWVAITLGGIGAFPIPS